MSVPTLDYASPPAPRRRARSDHGTTSCLVLCFIIACLCSSKILNEPALVVFAMPLCVCGLVTGAAGVCQRSANPLAAISGLLLNAAAGVLLYFDLHRVFL